MITYRLDSENRIIDVGGEWEQFARDNGGEMLSRDNVVGRSLFDFIAGPSIAQMYRAIFHKARQLQKTITFDLRCDAPECRRKIRLQVVPCVDNSLEVITEIIESMPRDRIPLFDRDAPRNVELISICCICSDIQAEDGSWVSIEGETNRRRLLELDVIPQLSHGYCPRCLDHQIKMLEALEVDSQRS